MKNDYVYCVNNGSCIHRRGCRRWIGNYTDREVHELYTKNRFVNEVDESKCIPDYSDVNCDNSFIMLDRFRFSDGTEFKGLFDE